MLTHDQQPAPNWRRFAAIIYDVFPLSATLMIAAGLWLGALTFLSPQIKTNLHIGQEVAHHIGYRIYLFIVIFLYFGVSWRYGGQTIGMRAWKIKLITTNQHPLTWSLIFLRFSAALFSTLCFGIGFLWCFINSDKKTWHDLVAQTAIQMIHVQRNKLMR